LHLQGIQQPPAQTAAAVPAGALAEQDKSFAGRVLASQNMKINSPDTKEHLIQRLRRIEGQLRGVQGMVNEERDCREIVQQLSAIRSALQGASRYFLQEYASSCLLEMGENENSPANPEERSKREKMIEDMINLLDKAP
jgi:DNA-binding FrmR family transcriptional regulator